MSCIIAISMHLYLDLGLELEAVHRVQEVWMKPYNTGQFYTEMRKKVTSPFQRILFKHMNNSCFGELIYISKLLLYTLLPTCYLHPGPRPLNMYKLISRTLLHTNYSCLHQCHRPLNICYTYHIHT
jgi:hypothetical protein